jgi:small subunit ribosomal protein S1
MNTMRTIEIERELLFQVMKQGRTVDALIGGVEKLDEPTWIVRFPDYPSFRGLVPLSAAKVDEPLMYKMIGYTIPVIIKGVDAEAGIVAGERAINTEVLSMLETDQTIPAVVVATISRGKRPFLVVDIQGVLVEIPRSKAAICYTKRLQEQFKAGQTVSAKVMSVEPLELSLRDARPDPWANADFRRGSIISGTVYTVANEKVFIEPDLCMGILGLAPVPLRGAAVKGMRVSCRVRFFDPEKKKLHLWLVNRL